MVDAISTDKPLPRDEAEQPSTLDTKAKAQAKDGAKGRSSGKAKVSYHLLWTPGFFPALVYWTVVDTSVLYMVLTTDDYRFFFEDLYEALLKQNLLFLAHEYAVWSLVTLLSSACCAFQLVLNVFSVGCAGFNTVLGPLRPFFLAMATVGQVWMWIAMERPDLQRRQAVASSLLVFGMSLLPEAVWFWTSSRSCSSGREPSTKPEVSVCACFKVSGMGCIACVNTITQSVLQRPGVKDVRVVLEKGTMEVEFCEAKSASDPALLEAVASTVTDSGFPAEVIEGSWAVQNHCDEGETGETTPAESLLKSLLAGLLSSSCCLLQLILNGLSLLNVVHVGCAGFNKALGGQVRMLLRTLTLCWLGYGWTVSSSGRQRKTRNWRLLRASALTITLMLLPEFLNGMQKASILSGRPLGELITGIAEAPGDAQAAHTHTPTKTLAFTIDNMGCEACLDLVSRVVDAHPGVVSSRIDFETGRTEIDLAADAALNDTKLDEELQEHGYELHKEGWVTKKMKAEGKNKHWPSFPLMQPSFS